MDGIKFKFNGLSLYTKNDSKRNRLHGQPTILLR